MRRYWMVGLALLGLVLVSAGAQAVQGDRQKELASGKLWVSGDASTAKIQIPITGYTWDKLEVSTCDDPDGPGTTVVGNYDLLLAHVASPGYAVHNEYLTTSKGPYTYTDSSYLGPLGIATGTSPLIYVGNTTNASYSGSASPVGQWVDWVIYKIFY